jgi:hypothetical protein
MSEERGLSAFFNHYLCQYEFRIRLAFLLSLTFLLVTIFSVFIVDPGTASFAVAVMNLFGLGLFTLLFGLLTWNCHRIDQ